MTEQLQIDAKRAAAARARRLARGVTDDAIRRRMMAVAAELDAEADALERAMLQRSAVYASQGRTTVQNARS